MKKLLALVLVLASLFSFSLALAEDTNTYALTDGYSVEQGPIWYYLAYSEDTDETTELFYNDEWSNGGQEPNWQFSDLPQLFNVYHSLCVWGGIRAMPGDYPEGKKVDIIVAFTAPKAGAATIEAMNLEMHADSGEHAPYLFNILYIESEEAEAVSLLSEDEEWVEAGAINAIDVELAEGSVLYFVVRASDAGGGAVLLQPVITYK